MSRSLDFTACELPCENPCWRRLTEEEKEWLENNPNRKAINLTRKKQTSLMAQKERASEWFGKCELEFEKYIKEHSIDGVFRLTQTDEFMAIYRKRTGE